MGTDHEPLFKWGHAQLEAGLVFATTLYVACGLTMCGEGQSLDLFCNMRRTRSSSPAMKVYDIRGRIVLGFSGWYVIAYPQNGTPERSEGGPRLGFNRLRVE
eukprot:3852530-Pyramimonas_sp.AAC.1